MGSAPQTNNQIALFIDEVVQALTNGGVAAAKSYILTTPASFLEWPVISIFTDAVLSGLADSISGQIKNAVAIVVIDVQTQLEKSAASQAVTALQKAKESGDADAIAKANAAFDDALSSLVHSDGSVNTST